MELYENRQEKEKVLLISFDSGDFNAEESIDELASLVDTAGGEAVLNLIQKLPEPNSATFIGSGRIAEVKNICENQEIDLIVADDELSPSQLKNIEESDKLRDELISRHII